MICASSFARPQNQRRDPNWFSLVILRKKAGRSNSNDLEIPGGEKNRLSFSKEKFLNITPSSKVDVSDVSVSEGSSTAAEQLKPSPKRETNRRCHRKIQIWSFWISLYGLFTCYCFQILCHFKMGNKVWQGFSGLTGFNRKILVTSVSLSV